MASSILIGAVMAHAEPAKPEKIHLIEMEFRLRGALLAAGRHPVYGMEERNVEKPSGSPAEKARLYQLSPLPIRYPAATQNENFSFDLFPSVPAEPCTLQVTLNLTDSPKAMADWLGQGLPAAWLRSNSNDVADEIRAWTPDLAGPLPKVFNVSVKRWGDGKAQAELGSHRLTQGQPVSFDLELPALGPSEKYLFEMPGLSFWWDRQPPRRSAVVWPRGKPAAAIDPLETAAKEPAPARTVRAKRPFWKFWQRAD
jgi:hypothetical protein